MQTDRTTYTYTARSVDNPDRVVTFTLLDDHMRINLTGLLDQANTVVASQERSGERSGVRSPLTGDLAN